MKAKQPVNVKYYRELLNSTSLNPLRRKFFEEILSTVEKQGGQATPRQMHVLYNIKKP
jgi:hypothetical protein